MKLKLLLIFALLLSHLAAAEEIVVGPGDSIQDAIDKAMPDDLIKVQSGTYYENLNVNKTLTLLGMDTGGGRPVIDGRRMDSAVTLNEDGIRFEGFTLTNSSRHGMLRSSKRLYAYYESGRPETPEDFYEIEPEGIGPQSAFSGILINGSENCTVENNTAFLNDVGIHLWKADHNTITNNIARENTYAGIALSRHCRNNSIQRNRAVKSISGDGIRVSGSFNTFVDNDASDNAFYGIWFWGSPSNILQANIAQNNGYSGLGLLRSSRDIVTKNYFSNNGESGIYITDSSNNSTLTANNVADNPVGIVLLGGSRDNLVMNNSVTKSEDYGIKLHDSSSNTIAWNHVYRNGAGIGLYSSSDDNKIEGNNASYNIGYGIDLDDCRNNVVRRNRADYNEWGGIGLFPGCEENSIEDNEVGYNNWAGINLNECQGNFVNGNIATRNVLSGFKLQGSHDNLLFHNDLVENAMDGGAIRTTSPLNWALLQLYQLRQLFRDHKAKSNAYDDANNQWDNGTTGNYYSDFNCTDSDGNGICDSEHAIPGGESVDKYPLARPKSSG